MKNKTFSILLWIGIILSCISCSKAEDELKERLPVLPNCQYLDDLSNRMDILEHYTAPSWKTVGHVRWNRYCLQINLDKFDVNELWTYESVFPGTGGDRQIVYINTDEDQGADYAIFIYSDMLTVRTSLPGFSGHYSEELGVFSYQINENYLSFSIPFDFLVAPPNLIWSLRQ